MSRELARLQTSVALTFGGNLGKRGGSLDPDTFAVESRRAERERLGLDRRFASVLAGLSSAVASAVGTDRARVRPARGRRRPERQRLRAAAAPAPRHLVTALVVVLAADVALLSTIMRLSYQGDSRGSARSASLSEADLSVAADLATNALRKHLPPAQRVVLGLVDPGRALALKPLSPASAVSARGWGRSSSRPTRRPSRCPRISA